MEGLRIPSGTYAKFLLIGMNIGGLYETIMTNWLPKSGYQIDARPHFQVMGKDYKQGSPESKEWVYVPIKKPTPQ
jgi:AraC family transcriptional regulator